MKKHLHKFESTLWLFLKCFLYISLLLIFIVVLGRGNVGLTRLSRTLAITLFAFTIVGLLFTNAYGKYDVGRRKSKPIIYSLSLAVLCTDLVTYVEVMIMRVNSPLVSKFRLIRPDLLILAFVIQVIVIIAFTYLGNAIFFTIHEPEKCVIVTSSQSSLNAITFAMSRFKKQYQIKEIVDYRNKDVKKYTQKADTVFLYDIPVDVRTDIMKDCYQRSINVYFNPEIEDIMELSAEQYVLDDMYLVNKNVKAITMEQRIMKRCIDIGLSLVLGILSSPFWIGGMLAVKLYDGGPALFTQERVTINGKRFQVYKIRTMKQNVINHSVTKDDDRITPPGKFLRRTRLDELPQLLNVLKGDMTFVGPRPEMIKNVQEYTEQLPEFAYRLRMKAGLTGYAQIYGKYNTSPKDKLVMDMMYIEQFSILKDIQLILLTAVVLLKSDSTEAFSNRKCEYKFIPADHDSAE